MRAIYLRFLHVIAIAVLLRPGLDATVQAGPLTTFTLTDLGPGMPTFATGANGGIVITGNGQTAYPFPATQDTSFSSTQSLAPGFPLLGPPPPTSSPNAYNDPLFVYSITLGPITANGNGLYVAIDASGVSGHQGTSEVYTVKQNTDGTWSSPTGMWSGGMQFDGQPSAGMASITGINKLNEVLGRGADPNVAWNGAGLPQTYLYNASANTLLNLASLGVIQAGDWNNLMPVAIDDQGRILLGASENPITGDRFEHTILLTPEGVSSNPVLVPAPEPGALALAVVTIAALALRRRFRRRR